MREGPPDPGGPTQKRTSHDAATPSALHHNKEIWTAKERRQAAAAWGERRRPSDLVWLRFGPRPWLQDKPDLHHSTGDFLAAFLHSDAPMVARLQACDEFSERSSRDDLVRALRHAAALAPLEPALADRLRGLTRQGRWVA
jgi:hypothetical protein